MPSLRAITATNAPLMLDDARLPLHVLTGFLGSGKTSLLRRLLQNPALADTVVVINEFGEIGLDHLLVREVAEDTILLPSGCLCCAVGDDLISTLADLLRTLQQETAEDFAPHAFRRVIIETSGLADPAPIMQAVMSDMRLSSFLRSGNIITVIDALCGRDTIEKFSEAHSQVALADRLVITKADLVSPWDIEALQLEVSRLNPAVSSHVIQPDKDDDVIKLLLSQDDWQQQYFKLSGLEDRVHHNRDIHSFRVTLPHKIVAQDFLEWLELLLMARGRSILRVKGLVSIMDETRPLVIHGVQHVVYPPEYLPQWPEDKEEGWLIFIARNLTQRAIERSLSENLFRTRAVDCT